MNEEVNVDNIVEKLTVKLSEYIESMPNDKLEYLITICKEGSTFWFENLIAETVCVYAQNELRKRKI